MRVIKIYSKVINDPLLERWIDELSPYMVSHETRKLSFEEAQYYKLMGKLQSGELVSSRTFEPERVVFNGPATIVFWKDGTKTVVKCQDGEPFDPEKGIAMAMLKKYFGGSRYNDVINGLIKKAKTCNAQKKS